MTLVESPSERAARLQQAREAAALHTDMRHLELRRWNGYGFKSLNVADNRCKAHRMADCVLCATPDGRAAAEERMQIELAKPASIKPVLSRKPIVGPPSHTDRGIRPCGNCGAVKPIAGNDRCANCYLFRRRNGYERPPHLWGRTAPQGIPPEERFKAKCVEQGDCLIWTGYINPDGYGLFTVGNTKTGKTFQAHRYAWQLEHGPLAFRERIRQTCGNRACVRHLEKVTPEQVRRAKRVKR